MNFVKRLTIIYCTERNCCIVVLVRTVNFVITVFPSE